MRVQFLVCTDYTPKIRKINKTFEFNPVNKNVNIKKEKENKEQYMDLLLEADPSENMINKYLKDGELFVLTYKDEVAGIAVVINREVLL